MLRKGKWTDKFFIITTGDDGSKAYTLKTPEQFQVHKKKKVFAVTVRDDGSKSHTLKNPERFQIHKKRNK
jgi:hypothetical protein